MIHKYYVNDILLFLFLRFVFSSAIFHSKRLQLQIIHDTGNGYILKSSISPELLLLRGGSEENNEPNAKSGLWSSINNVFQMNLNAKDELGNDDTNRIIHLDKRRLLSSLGGGEALMQVDDEDATNGDILVSDEILPHDPEISDHAEIDDDMKNNSGHESVPDMQATEMDEFHDDVHADGSVEEMKNVNDRSMRSHALDPFQPQLEDQQSIKESIDEIVREEWNMVPDTEVEDEGNDFHEVAGASTGKSKDRMNVHKQAKMKTSNTKLSEVEDTSTYFSNDKISEQKEDYIMNLDDTINPTQIDSPSVEVSADSSSNAYVSSGLWPAIDIVSSMGLSMRYSDLRISKKLRGVRKAAAHYTGMHGILSGKGKSWGANLDTNDSVPLNEEEIIQVRRRIAAIENARKKVAAISASATARVQQRTNQGPYAHIPRWRRPFARFKRQNQNVTSIDDQIPKGVTEESSREKIEKTPVNDVSSVEIEQVQQIDRRIEEGKRRIYELQCQKDEIQRRPNPLYSYTQGRNTTNATFTRKFNFPTDNLVSEYLDDLFSSGRILKLNHTDLWRQDLDATEDEDDDIGSEILNSSTNGKQSNENKTFGNEKRGNGAAGGSWLLRQSIGTGVSLGEKIGEAVETAAYKGVCNAIMGILARSISALHGVNVMKHADIRIFVESAPDLPPVSKSVLNNEDYAREAIGKAVRKGSKKKKSRKQKVYVYGSGDETFLQRDAVVETLISHCQISAPLLKLFPLAWQRALLGNIITLIAAIVSDFADGVQFQILGHQLSFAFQPITEADMIKHIGLEGLRFNHRRSKPEDFEAAVRATAEDISINLSFLDRWHERVLGGDLLRAQIGNLIARVVLTLVDEVLHSARMDLWCNQANGPRIVAGLEYRTKTNDF